MQRPVVRRGPGTGHRGGDRRRRRRSGLGIRGGQLLGGGGARSERVAAGEGTEGGEEPPLGLLGFVGGGWAGAGRASGRSEARQVDAVEEPWAGLLRRLFPDDGSDPSVNLRPVLLALLL